MKTAVIYWSGTGNTQMMAEAVAVGANVVPVKVSAFFDSIADYDRVALGCPAMGAEVLEEDEFEPFFASIENELSGKTVALFGSYGWGDGEWMRNWVERCNNAGANVIDGEGLIINDTPSDNDLDMCKLLGEKLVG